MAERKWTYDHIPNQSGREQRIGGFFLPNINAVNFTTSIGRLPLHTSFTYVQFLPTDW